MDREETKTILRILRIGYPNFYKDLKKAEADEIIDLWATMFSDDPVQAVVGAVKSLMCDLKFPPTIADVKEKINFLTQPEQMTEQEAWNRISKAMRNSTYHASEEFEKLPDILKQLVGGPSQLKEWAMMEGKEVQTVVSSNLMRSYKVKAAKEKEYQSLPGDVKRLIENPSLKIEGGNG